MRALQGQVEARLKRGEAWPASTHGLIAGVLDGQESHATFRRHGLGCLTRTINPAAGERTQYYHRHVSLQLVGADWALLLDTEPQRPGQDEVAAALRLGQRVLARYPRAFDGIVADGFYADPRLFNFVYSRGQDVLAVLKENHPARLEDARSLFATRAPVSGRYRTRTRPWWDLPGFTTWPQVAAPIRIVRSSETGRCSGKATVRWKNNTRSGFG